MSLRVAVADDPVLVRRGVTQVLECSGLHVVAAVGTADELLEVSEAVPVDAAVVDIRMPATHTDEGVRALEELRARGSPVGVLLLLSMYVSVPSALRVLAAGRGTGYLLKERVADEQTLTRAVATVSAAVRSSTPSWSPCSPRSATPSGRSTRSPTASATSSG